jgi:cell division septal protein FtsQ
VSSTVRANTARIVVPIKRRRKRRRALNAALPSGRTIALLFAALATAVGLYALARESTLFAIRTVEVNGGPPALSRQVGAAVRSYKGRSLVGLDGAAIERSILAIPDVQTVRIDRDFPNTLRVFVKRELSVAILRSGQDAWLIAASDKIVRRVTPGRFLKLPRIWAPRSVAIAVAAPIADRSVRTAVKVLAELRRAGSKLSLTNVVASDGTLTLVTSSRIELRFGDATQTALKLAVVEKILADLGPAPAGSIGYLDVSLPSRPVAGTTTESRGER